MQNKKKKKENLDPCLDFFLMNLKSSIEMSQKVNPSMEWKTFAFFAYALWQQMIPNLNRTNENCFFEELKNKIKNENI